MLNRNREWCNKIIYNVTIYKTLTWTEPTTLKLPLATETLISLNIKGMVGGSLLRCNYYDEYLANEQEDFCERYIKFKGELRTTIWRTLSCFVENCLVTASRHLRAETGSEVWVILFPKINRYLSSLSETISRNDMLFWNGKTKHPTEKIKAEKEKNKK